MLEIKLDITKQEAQKYFQIIFEGFSDGTDRWDAEDSQPAWRFLEKLEDAVTHATIYPG